MQRTGQALSAAALRASYSLRYFIRHRTQEVMDMADDICRFLVGVDAADRLNSRLLLPTYNLRRTVAVMKEGAVGDADFDFCRRQIGLVIGNADYARLHRTFGTRGAESWHLGYFRITVIDRRPQVEWLLSPFRKAAVEKRPPVVVTSHHDERGFATYFMTEPLRRGLQKQPVPNAAYRERFVNAQEMGEILWRNRRLRSILDRYPDSDVFLNSCLVSEGEAEVIAKKIRRKLYYSTGESMNFHYSRSVDAVGDSSILPFSVTDDVRQAFHSSLDAAPENFTKVGNENGWSVLAVFADAGSLPPINMVTPK